MVFQHNLKVKFKSFWDPLGELELDTELKKIL